ncbi:MAG TPA: hypothetical protein VGF91_29265 [Solirubrobacteraceae bacterium]
MSAGQRRSSRALVAWMSAAEVARLRGNAGDAGRAERARVALARRPAGLDQSALIEPWPAALELHGAALRDSQGAKPMFDNGWELAVIGDLRRVVAAQPTVFTDEVEGDGLLAAPDDLAALARLTLPLSPPSAQLPAHFDEESQTWNISSPSPNLRITGTFAGEVKPDVLGFGFLLEVLTSFVSVAEFRGRYILRDGYHRTHNLLSAGLVRVPAFVRHFDDADELFRQGMLPVDAYCGERPPTLADYHDDGVSADVSYTPSATRVLVKALPAGLALGRLL